MLFAYLSQQVVVGVDDARHESNERRNRHSVDLQSQQQAREMCEDACMHQSCMHTCDAPFVTMQSVKWCSPCAQTTSCCLHVHASASTDLEAQQDEKGPCVFGVHIRDAY